MFIKNRIAANVIQNSLYDALNTASIVGVVKTFSGDEYHGKITFDYSPKKRKYKTERGGGVIVTRMVYVIIESRNQRVQVPITEVLYIKTSMSLSLIHGVLSKPYKSGLEWEFEKHPIYKKILKWIENKVPVGIILYNGVMFKGYIYSVYPFAYLLHLSNENADVIIPKHAITVITNCPDEFYPIYLSSYISNKKNMPDLQHSVPKKVWWKESLTKKLLGTVKHKKFVSVLLRDHSVSFIGRAAMLSPTIYGLKIYVKRVPDDYAKWRKVMGKPIEDYVGCVAFIYRHAIKGIRWIRKRDLLRTPTSKKVKGS